MKTIYKYPIEITDEQKIQMPLDAKVIHAGLDPNGIPCIWAMASSHLADHSHYVYVRGTGHEISDSRRHIGSFVEGPFMWHVFVD